MILLQWDIFRPEMKMGEEWQEFQYLYLPIDPNILMKKLYSLVKNFYKIITILFLIHLPVSSLYLLANNIRIITLTFCFVMNNFGQNYFFL